VSGLRWRRTAESLTWDVDKELSIHECVGIRVLSTRVGGQMLDNSERGPVVLTLIN
jgi:hypothetical protein